MSKLRYDDEPFWQEKSPITFHSGVAGSSLVLILAFQIFLSLSLCWNQKLDPAMLEGDLDARRGGSRQVTHGSTKSWCFLRFAEWRNFEYFCVFLCILYICMKCHGSAQIEVDVKDMLGRVAMLLRDVKCMGTSSIILLILIFCWIFYFLFFIFKRQFM